MKIFLDKDRAIKILRERISELDSIYFNAEAWKERTILDLKEIYSSASGMHTKIQYLNFDTPFKELKHEVLKDGKDTAKALLSSYIDSINEYIQTAERKISKTEESFEQKYTQLVKEYKSIEVDFLEVQTDYKQKDNDNFQLHTQIETLRNEIKHIRKETIQLDNVSLLKLTKAFFNLPIWQIVTALSVILSIVIGVFSLGKTYQENVDNNTLFEHKVKVNKLEGELLKSDSTIIRQQAELNQLYTIINKSSTPK